MDVEGILAIIFLFGGGTAVALGFSPVGRAFADRIRGRQAARMWTSCGRSSPNSVRS